MGQHQGFVPVDHSGDGQPSSGRGVKVVSFLRGGNEEFYSVNRTKSINLFSNMGWMEKNTRKRNDRCWLGRVLSEEGNKACFHQS